MTAMYLVALVAFALGCVAGPVARRLFTAWRLRLRASCARSSREDARRFLMAAGGSIETPRPVKRLRSRRVA